MLISPRWILEKMSWIDAHLFPFFPDVSLSVLVNAQILAMQPKITLLFSEKYVYGRLGFS